METLLEESLVQSLDLQNRIGRCMLDGLYIYANYYQEIESPILFAWYLPIENSEDMQEVRPTEITTSMKFM